MLCKGKNTQDQTRDKIIRSALEEFANHGYSGTRMDSIAKRAKVNQSLIHYHFGSKEQLYQEILSSLFGVDSEKTNEPQLAIHTGHLKLDPAQKLYLIIYFTTSMFNCVDSLLSFRIIFWEFAEGSPFIKPFFNRYTIPRLELIMKIINDGIAAGQFECINPMLEAISISNLFSFNTTSQLIYSGTDWEEKLSKQLDQETLFKFVIDQIFKTLTPAGKPRIEPVISKDLTEFMDNLINMMKTDVYGKNSEQVIAALVNLFSR